MAKLRIMYDPCGRDASARRRLPPMWSAVSCAGSTSSRLRAALSPCVRWGAGRVHPHRGRRGAARSRCAQGAALEAETL